MLASPPLVSNWQKTKQVVHSSSGQHLAGRLPQDKLFNFLKTNSSNPSRQALQAPQDKPFKSLKTSFFTPFLKESSFSPSRVTSWQRTSHVTNPRDDPHPRGQRPSQGPHPQRPKKKVNRSNSPGTDSLGTNGINLIHIHLHFFFQHIIC